jgi:hypothetical protein
MGTYLFTGICTTIYVSKEDLLKNKISVENFESEISKDFNLKIFTKHENDEIIEYQLKPKLIEKELFNIVDKQYKLFFDNEKKYKTTIDKLKNLKTSDDFLDYANDKSNMYFQMDKYFYDYYRFDFGKDIRVKMDKIILFGDGKILMESYDQIFKYLNKNLRMNCSEFQLADALHVYISC